MFDAQKAEAEAEATYKPYRFKDLDGSEHELPHRMMLTEYQMQRIRRGDTLELLGEIAPDAAKAIGEFPVWMSSQLAEDWLTQGPASDQEDSGKDSSG